MEAKLHALRIGYDAKRLFFNHTGLGNYGRTLVRNVYKHFPGSDIALYSPANPRDSEFKDLFSEEQFTYMFPGPSTPLWRSIGISNAIKSRALDIYHGLSNELPFFTAPLKGTSTVITVHDLLFMDFPEDYSFIDRSIYGRKTKSSCKAANAIVAISEWTKLQLIEKLGIQEEKIKLAYQSIRAPFYDLELQEIPSELPYGSKAYMLYVGTVSYRKNLLGILAGMVEAGAENCAPLVVVGGGKGKYYDKCRALAKELGTSVHWMSAVSLEMLIALYDHALFSIYPSRAEGFGLPVVESMQRGTPVITSNGSALLEAGGDCALKIDPESLEEMAVAIKSFSSDSTDRARSLEGVEQHLLQFDSLHTSSRMVQIYEEVLGR